jgi:hypothetical protein
MRKKNYVVFFLMAFTIPVIFGILAWQSNKSRVIKSELIRLENDQEVIIEKNRTITAEINVLLSVNKLENDAREKLGLYKIRPEDVSLIILGGMGSGFPE